MCLHSKFEIVGFKAMAWKVKFEKEKSHCHGINMISVGKHGARASQYSKVSKRPMLSKSVKSRKKYLGNSNVILIFYFTFGLSLHSL